MEEFLVNCRVRCTCEDHEHGRSSRENLNLEPSWSKPLSRGDRTQKTLRNPVASFIHKALDSGVRLPGFKACLCLSLLSATLGSDLISQGLNALAGEVALQ